MHPSMKHVEKSNALADTFQYFRRYKLDRKEFLLFLDD